MVAEIDPDIHFDRAPAADALELAELEDAQQLRLRRRRQLANLVEKHGAAVCQLQLSWLRRRCPGEGAAFMPEQLGLEQGLGERGAVEGDERACRPRAVAVERARHQLLAGTGLTGDQHRDVRGRHLLDEVIDALHRLAAPHHLVGDAEPVLQPLGFGQEGLETADVPDRDRPDPRDGREQLQVQAIERRPGIGRGQVEHAGDHVLVEHRHREDTAQVRRREAARILQRLIVERRVRQNRLAAPNRQLEDGGARRRRGASITRAALHDRAFPGSRIDTHERSLGRGHHLERRVEQLPLQRGAFADACDTSGNPHQRLQVALRSRAIGQLRPDGQIHRVVQSQCRGVRQIGWRGAFGRAAMLGVKEQLRAGDAQPIAVRERGLADLLLVDERAVDASHVAHQPFVTVPGQQAVPS